MFARSQTEPCQLLSRAISNPRPAKLKYPSTTPRRTSWRVALDLVLYAGAGSRVAAKRPGQALAGGRLQALTRERDAGALARPGYARAAADPHATRVPEPVTDGFGSALGDLTGTDVGGTKDEGKPIRGSQERDPLALETGIVLLDVAARDGDEQNQEGEGAGVHSLPR